MAKTRRNQQSQEGLGGVTKTTLIEKRTASSDLKLIRQAINNGWMIPAEVMRELPEEMMDMVRDRGADPRARVNAAKVLVDMVGQCREAAGPTVNVGVVVNGQDLLD